MKLTITREGKSSVITSIEEGLALLRAWDILPEQSPERSPSTSKMYIQDEWHVVSHQWKNKKHSTWVPPQYSAT